MAKRSRPYAVLRRLMCAIGFHDGPPEYVGCHKRGHSKRYRFYCPSCQREFSRSNSRQLAD